MKQNFIILCESAILEKDTEKISLIGLFEKIITDTVPIIYPKFSVVTRFEDGVGQHDHKILILHEESKKTIAELPGKIIFSDNRKAQYIGTFVGIPFSAFGKYKIETYVDNELQPINAYLEISPK